MHRSPTLPILKGYYVCPTVSTNAKLGFSTTTERGGLVKPWTRPEFFEFSQVYDCCFLDPSGLDLDFLDTLVVQQGD